MQVKVEFEGGLQTDFDAPDGINVDVPTGTTLHQLAGLIIAKHNPKSKDIRFVDATGSVVAGILVMLNEVDSEVEGMEVVLNPGDVVTYISTLHGG